jgi:calcineurin-like phosphoesterase family protein
MKIALASDLHWCQYSSIVRKRGEKYSLRLENEIASLNWFYDLAKQNDCYCTFILGDFFDKSSLNAEEISALKEINWAPMTNTFVAGNHEMGLSCHDYSSSKLFNLLDTSDVISEPTSIQISNTQICILPYILEENRKSIDSYFPLLVEGNQRIILSHNDIRGIQMGQFISKDGFSVEEIENNCDLYINGHLHNGERISKKIINIGNLTGQNFSEDATKYPHCAFILDTDTLHIDVYENPFAFNFYKLVINSVEDLQNIQLKENSVCTIRCKESIKEPVGEWIDSNYNIIESRIVIQADNNIVTENNIEELTVDHLKQFQEYILKTFDNTEVLLKELKEVCN